MKQALIVLLCCGALGLSSQLTAAPNNVDAVQKSLAQQPDALQKIQNISHYVTTYLTKRNSPKSTTQQTQDQFLEILTQLSIYLPKINAKDLTPNEIKSLHEFQEVLSADLKQWKGRGKPSFQVTRLQNLQSKFSANLTKLNSSLKNSQPNKGKTITEKKPTSTDLEFKSIKSSSDQTNSSPLYSVNAKQSSSRTSERPDSNKPIGMW